MRLTHDAEGSSPFIPYSHIPLFLYSRAIAVFSLYRASLAEMCDEPVRTGPGRGPSARTASRCSEVRVHTLIFGQPGLHAPTIPHLPCCPHLLISSPFRF